MSSKPASKQRGGKGKAAPKDNNQKRSNGAMGMTNKKGFYAGPYPATIGMKSDTTIEEMVEMKKTQPGLNQLPYDVIYFSPHFRILCPGCGFTPSKDPLTGLKGHCLGAEDRGGCPAFMSMFASHLKFLKTQKTIKKDGKKIKVIQNAYYAKFRNSFMADQKDVTNKEDEDGEETPDDQVPEEYWRKKFENAIDDNKGDPAHFKWNRHSEMPPTPLSETLIQTFAVLDDGIAQLKEAYPGDRSIDLRIEQLKKYRTEKLNRHPEDTKGTDKNFKIKQLEAQLLALKASNGRMEEENDEDDLGDDEDDKGDVEDEDEDSKQTDASQLFKACATSSDEDEGEDEVSKKRKRGNSKQCNSPLRTSNRNRKPSAKMTGLATASIRMNGKKLATASISMKGMRPTVKPGLRSTAASRSTRKVELFTKTKEELNKQYTNDELCQYLIDKGVANVYKNGRPTNRKALNIQHILNKIWEAEDI